MENYIKNIELINDHLLGRFSVDEEMEFLNRLNTNNAFRLLFEEQKQLLIGIKTYALKMDIQNAYISYKLTKLVKNTLLTVLVMVLIIFTIYLLVDLSSGNEIRGDETNFITLDTIKTSEQKSIEFSESLKVENLKSRTVDSNSLSVKTIFKHLNSNQINEVSEESDKEKVSTNDGIIQVYQSWEEKPQVIFMDISKDTIILCGKGTILGIKANSLIIAETQQKVTEKIKIEVQEYYELSEIIFANLSTSANTDLLETGGMVHLKITSEGKECILDKGKTIEVGFPKNGRKSKMNLFFGNEIDNNVNWKLMASRSDTIKNVSFSKVDTEIKEEVIDVVFGSKEDLNERKRSDARETKQIMEILIKEDSSKTVNKSLTQVSHYIFKSSELGWLNCDRFVRVGKPKINYVVDVETIENVDVKIVFDDFNSILNGKTLGDKFIFNNVPLDEKITIVAIKYELNQYYLSILKTIIKEDAKLEFNFEPITPENIKTKIQLIKD